MAPSRRPEVERVTGGYCTGQRFDVLFDVAGARAVVAALGATCIERLDAALTRQVDLYELAGDLAPLGVLLELRDVGVRVPPAQVDAWQQRFAAADERTREERGFWDIYAGRVAPAFALLKAAV